MSLICCALLCAEKPNINSKTAVVVTNFLFGLNLKDLFSTQWYKMGNTNNVSNVEVNNPPITTVANGRCTSAPADAEIAIGKKPKTSVKAVNIIGLILRFVPSMILSLRLVTPSSFNSFSPLIITRPLRTATPNKTIKPTPAEILNGISLNHNATTPPMVAIGIAI